MRRGIRELADGFRKELGSAIGLDVPPDAWWAMDYHLDWLQAALSSVDEAPA